MPAPARDDARRPCLAEMIPRMRSLLRLRAAASILATLAVAAGAGGCPNPGPAPPDETAVCLPLGDGLDAPPDTGRPFLWIGTNAEDDSYRSIQSGETLAIQHGPQGGEHVWGAARLYTPGKGSWTLSFALTAADGTVLAATDTYVEACAGQIAELTSATVFLQKDGAATGVFSVDADEAGHPEASVHAEVPISIQ
jgi:hypothetical protein